MEAVSVQFALLAVARASGDAPAELQAATERATAAGHQIVGEEIIADSEAALRAQLQRFIADPQVDVVIVLAGAESDAASRALKPLISEVLPGFTDLFRWLMFQEAGASAMLSSAEAAQCDSTIVFVLPGAIGPAMEKLILPQFDPNTTPRNLVEKLARLRTEPGEGVPLPITQEKTQGGSGLPARLPAPSGRMRSRTGANVVHREQPTNDPTRKIDLFQLENELAASGAKRDDVTKITSAAPNREVTANDTEATEYAPGADEDHTAVTLAAAPPPKLPQHPGTIPSLVKSTTAPRSVTVPAVPAKPGARAYVGTPAAPMPVVRLPAVTPTEPSVTPIPTVTIQPRNRPPSGDPPSKPATAAAFNEERTVIAPNPAAAAKAADAAAMAKHEERTVIAQNPMAAAKAADAAVMREEKRASKPAFEEARTTVAAPAHKPFANVPKPAEKPKPVSTAIKGDTKPGIPAPTAFDEARTTHAQRDSSLDFDEARTVRAPAKPPTPPTPPKAGGTNPAAPAYDEARTMKAPSKPAAPPAAKPAPPKPMFNETPTVVAPPAKNGKANGAAAAPAPAPVDDLDQAAKTVDGASGVLSLSAVDAIEHIDPADLEEATPTPAPRPKRPPTEPPPAPVAAKRTPTAPPPPSTPSEAPPARKLITAELPRGSFAYPVQKRKGSLIVKLLIAAAIIGVGFGAVVLIFREKDKTAAPTTAQPPPPPPTTPTPPPATNPVVAAAPDAPEAPPPTPEPEPVIEPTPTPTPTPDVGSAKPPATKPPATKPPATKPPATKPPATKPPATKPPATKPPTTPDTPSVTDVVPPVANDDCDETACILSKYDRPCCAKYKPAASPDLAPRVGDTPESLDKSMVRAGIERLKPRVVKCGEKSGAKGTVKISMTVSPDGAVTSASVADTPEAALGDCVLAAMRSAKFGKTVNGATFTYPFSF